MAGCQIHIELRWNNRVKPGKCPIAPGLNRRLHPAVRAALLSNYDRSISGCSSILGTCRSADRLSGQPHDPILRIVDNGGTHALITHWHPDHSDPGCTRCRLARRRASYPGLADVSRRHPAEFRCATEVTYLGKPPPEPLPCWTPGFPGWRDRAGSTNRDETRSSTVHYAEKPLAWKQPPPQ